MRRYSIAGKALFTVLCSMVLIASGTSQTLSSSLGVGTTDFVNFSEGEHMGEMSHSAGSYQFVKLDFEEYLPEAKFLSISLKMDRSEGSITSRSYFMFCGVFPTNFQNLPDLHHRFSLYRFSLGIAPININVYRGIKVKAGVDLSRILKFDATPLKDEIDEAPSFFPGSAEDVVNKMGFGTFMDIQFGEIGLGNHFSMVPFYHGSLGLINEIETNFNTKTMRHSIGIALKSKLTARN